MRKKIRSKLLILLESLAIPDSPQPEELDVKNLEGEWQGFWRLRVGKIRIIFTIDREKDQLVIYSIGFRGDVYKRT